MFLPTFLQVRVIARLCRFVLFLLLSKDATASAAHKFELAENKSVSESRFMFFDMVLPEYNQALPEPEVYTAPKVREEDEE